jgi:hypothetical protein
MGVLKGVLTVAGTQRIRLTAAEEGINTNKFAMKLRVPADGI